MSAIGVRPVAVQRRFPVFVALVVALAAAALASLCLGRYPVSPGTTIAILGAKLLPLEVSWTGIEERIVLLVRGPRVVLAAICGAGLAISGAALQGVFRNPLVSPHILGVSSGASFGGALAILLGIGGLAMVGSAFVFGAGALLIVGVLSRAAGRGGTVTIVLTGVVVAALFSALVSLLIVLADPESSLPGIVFWLMGSFAAATPDKLLLAGPLILVGIAVIAALRFHINVLSLGEDDARAMGMRVDRDRWMVLLAVALVEAGIVSFAGVIGWVGLVVPHAARFMVGPDHRVLLPASALLGATYLLAIDTVARSATAVEIPLGVLTAIIGAPIFAVILVRRRSREAGE